MINSYPKIFPLGHRAIQDLFTVIVRVEEKIDGSQISFGIFEGELQIRSKGATINPDAPNSMFSLGVEVIKKFAPTLHPGWTYRGEYLQKPKHNTLSYSRVPKNNIILFDVDRGNQDFLTPLEILELDIDLESVPFFGPYQDIDDCYDNRQLSLNDIHKFLEKESVLGGTKIEGIVIKPWYGKLFGEDKKVLMGKYVSEVFKEKHSKSWKSRNPRSKDILFNFGEIYRTPARWEKAIQHLRDAGELNNSSKDIGSLIFEIKKDVQEECEEEIRDALWKWAWPSIQIKIVAGAAEYYKRYLLEQQFAQDGVRDPTLADAGDGV